MLNINNFARPLRWTLPALAGAAVALSLSGCDQQAASVGEMQTLLNQSISQVERAQQGYVPQDSGGGKLLADDAAYEEIRSVEDFRQETLDTVISDLDTVAQKGTPQQRATANELLGTIHRTRAVFVAGQGTAASAELMGRGADLLSLAQAVDVRHAGSQSLAMDAAAVLQQLESELAQTQDNLKQATQKVNELRTARDEALAAEKTQRDKAAAKQAEAQAASEKAFATSGDEHYKLLDQAAEARRAGTAAAIQADRFAQSADDIAVRLASAELQLNAVTNAVEQLQSKIAATKDQASSRQTSAGELGAERDELAQQLISDYETMQASFDESVDGRFEFATKRIDMAITSFDEAAKLIGKRYVSDVEEKGLAARLDKASILSRHATAVTAQRKLAESLATSLASAGVAAEPIDTAVAQLRSLQDELTASLNEAVQDAKERAEAINAGPDVIEQLDSYVEQVSTL